MAYAARVKRQRTNSEDHTTCHLSPQYSKGGLHVVRQLYFGDGTSCVARLQMERPTNDSRQRLIHEIHTIQVLRECSMIPIPEIITYEASADNAVGVLFISADTVMDKFQGRLPAHLKKTYYDEMAAIQVSKQFHVCDYANEVRLRCHPYVFPRSEASSSLTTKHIRLGPYLVSEVRLTRRQSSSSTG
jgi:hypothetical protein